MRLWSGFCENGIVYEVDENLLIREATKTLDRLPVGVWSLVGLDEKKEENRFTKWNRWSGV